MHIINDSLSDVVQSDETRILYGQDYFYETLLGLKFRISTFSFFQPKLTGSRSALFYSQRVYPEYQRYGSSLTFTAEPERSPSFSAPVAEEVIGVRL